MRIAIIGYYGANNFGDELMLEGIISALDKNLSISVLGLGDGTIVPFFSDHEHQYRFVSIRGGDRILGKIKALYHLIIGILNSDVVLFGGGTILFDNVKKSYRNLFGPLKVILIAKLFQKRLGLYGCGIGELNSSPGILISTFILNACELICVRDNKSFNMLKKLKISKKGKIIKIVKDPAYMAPFIKKDRIIFPSGKYKVISLIETYYRETGYFKEDHLIDILVQYINSNIDSGFNICLLPMQEDVLRNDNNVHLKLFNKIKDEKRGQVLLANNYNFALKKNILSNANAIISMRYHPLVVGEMLNIKTFVLAISEKCRRFAIDNLEADNYVDISQKKWALQLKKALVAFDSYSGHQDSIKLTDITNNQSHFKLLMMKFLYHKH